MVVKMSASVEKKTKKDAYRKRKQTESKTPHAETKSARVQRQDDFTEVEFKLLLRNSNAVFTGFEKFIEAADRWPSERQYDVVAGFLRSTTECSEIFQVLETGRRKIQELQLIFRCFEKILLRIAEDLDKYFTTGQLIVRKLLSTQLSSIYFTLSVRHKSSQIKTTLKLLVAMVMLGPTAGKTVLNQIDLNHANIKPLFFRRDRKDEEDVRTCMLHLIVAFLLAGDNEVIRRLADTKGFLASVFQGIVFDRVATIQLVLSTFLEKIIMNPVISKTSKVHIFTESSLKQLGQLYSWKGPAKWKEKDKDSKELEIEDGDDIIADDDRQTVAQITHKFLTELCSSYKFGINFMDKTYGTSGRNQNHILTSFLVYLSTISQKALIQELVVKILVASPDQLGHFLLQMAHSLSPRATDKWVDAVRFLCKIFDAQPDEPHILKSREHLSMSKVVNILLIHTLPPLQILNTVLPGVKNKTMAISYMSLMLVKVIAHQCVSILRVLADTDCPLRTVCTVEEYTDIVTSFKDAVTKSLPDSMEIFLCLDRLQALNKNETSQQIQELAELCHADQSDVMVRIEQVLSFYQEINPALLLDHPLELVKLLDAVSLVDSTSRLDTSGTQNEDGDENEAASEEVTETGLLPQLYLLKLLSGTDARRLPWGKEGHSGHTLMYQLLSMVTHGQQNSRIREIALQLICKLLDSTGLFDTFSDELYRWMKHLQTRVSVSQDSSDLLMFVSKVMMMYMTNPYPYMDRVADLVSEVVSIETGEAAVELSKAKLDRQMEEILAMDLENLEDDEESVFPTSQVVARRHPFCPVLLVAVDHLQKLEVESEDIKVYLSSVILDIFHSQTDPAVLCLMIKQVPGNSLVEGLQDFMKTWLPPYKLKKSKKQFLNLLGKVQGHLMQNLHGDQHNISMTLGTEPVDLDLTTKQCLLYVDFLLEKDLTETSKPKISHMLEFLSRLLCHKDMDLESKPKSSLPSEFSDLEIKKKTRTEELESVYRLIFEHPSIKNWFLADMDGNLCKPGSGKNYEPVLIVVSEFVLNCVIHLKSLGIGLNFKEELNFYIDKILSYIKQKRHQSSEITNLVVKMLIYLLDFLNDEKSITVLNTVLDLDKDDVAIDKYVIEITKHIMQNLTSQDTLSLRLGDHCIQNLVSLTNRSEDMALLDSVVGLFKKFPNLSILCSETNVAELLEMLADTRLLEILITNSEKLRKCVETCFLPRSRLMKENRMQILPLVKIFLCFQAEASASVSSLESAYMPKIMELCQSGSADETDRQNLVEIFQQFIRIKAIDKKTFKKLEKKLESTLELNASLDCHHLQLIQMILGCQTTEDVSHERDSRRKLLRFCVQGLIKTVSQKDKKSYRAAKRIIKIVSGFSQKEIHELGSHWNDLAERWPQLLKGCLKYLYTEPEALKLLTDLLPPLYETDEETAVSIETIITMVMSHSSFLPVMFNEESPEAKEPLLDLLIQLVSLGPSHCEEDHFGIFLGSYRATLTLTDQKLLKLMHMYEKSGINFSPFKPFLWGEKAIEHHTLRKSMGPSLLKQPTMVQVLSNLQPWRMTKTILNFPLRRKLQVVDPQEASEFKSLPGCYDPCFLMPLFSHLLAPASVVDCRKFIERDCLGLVFTALSSHDQSMRSAAYHIIKGFQDHIPTSKFMEMDQILYILVLLRDSLGKSKSKLASIVTIFLARTVKIMLKPDDHMYGLLNSFLLLKPSLDVANIPEFYKLFNSSALEYKVERQWILSLLVDGLRETADYRIFERRYTFKLLQGFYDSDLSDTPTQLKVLQILHSACKERSVALDLIRYYGFLTWISGAVQKLKPEMTEHVSLLGSIINSLWFTLLDKKSYPSKGSLTKGDKQVGNKEAVTEKTADEEAVITREESTKKEEFLQPTISSQMLIILQALLWYMRDVEEPILQTYIDTLSSVIDNLQATAGSLKESNDKLILPTLSLADILLLLFHVRKFIPSRTAQVAMKIISGLGYHVSLLTQAKGVTFKKSFSKNLKEVSTELTVDDEVEKEGKTDLDVDDNDSGTVARIEKKTETAANQTIEETLTDRPRQNLDVIKTYVTKLTRIITTFVTEEEEISDQRVAGLIAMISWCLEQIKYIDDISVLCAVVKWIKSCIEHKEPVIQVIASESGIAKDLLDRLLNIYATANSSRVSSDFTDFEAHDSIEKNLNAILQKLAGARLRNLARKPGIVPSEDLTESEKMRSVTLQKYFLSVVNDNSTLKSTSDENEEIMDNGSSSEEEFSEIVEVQEFKMTPEIKEYFEHKMAKSKPEIKSRNDKSPGKKGNSPEKRDSASKKRKKTPAMETVDSRGQELSKSERKKSVTPKKRKLFS